VRSVRELLLLTMQAMAAHLEKEFGEFVGQKLNPVTCNNIASRFGFYLREALTDAYEDPEGWGVLVEPDEDDPSRVNVAPDLPERLRTKPMHPHDCEECQFVSVALLPHSSGIRDYQDIYVCNKAGWRTVVVRFGSGSDYTSLVSLVGAISARNSPLWEAVQTELERRGHL